MKFNIFSFDSAKYTGFFSRKIRLAYRSPKWSKVRSEHLSLHPSCAACGRSLKVEVHHIVPVHLKPELELDLTNLITLCDNPCHFVFGHFMNWKSWNKDVVKDTKVYYNKYKNKPI